MKDEKMFLQNKYYKYYCNIISSRQKFILSDGYFELHHIIPKAAGGTNDSSNLVKLTAREHFLCHLLLAKCTEADLKHKMVHAVNLMRRAKSKIKITGTIFDMIKRMVSEERSGKLRSTETKKKISVKLSGRKLSTEHILNRSKAQTGTKRSKETRDKLSGPKSNQHRNNLSIALKGKLKSESHRANMKKPKSEEHVKKIKEIAQNRVWISKDDKTKRILKKDLDLFLINGWVHGRHVEK